MCGIISGLTLIIYLFSNKKSQKKKELKIIGFKKKCDKVLAIYYTFRLGYIKSGRVSLLHEEILLHEGTLMHSDSFARGSL